MFFETQCSSQLIYFQYAGANSVQYTSFSCSTGLYNVRRNAQQRCSLSIRTKLSYCCDSQSYCMKEYDRLKQLLRDYQL